MTQVQRHVGYCPQFDALIDQMTPSETLYMFGRLRGVKERDLKPVIEELIDLLQLTVHADKLVKACRSGKRNPNTCYLS